MRRPLLFAAPTLLLSLLALVTLAQLSPAPLAQVPAPAYRIIVNPRGPSTTLDRRGLEDVFLKKVRSWPGGEIIRPVDLHPNSPVRARFTEEVLRRKVSAVRAYWQQRIFSGQDVPPPEVDNDAEVIEFVMRHTGAIGYVSGGAPLNGARELPSR